MEKPHRAVRRAAAGPYVLATALCLLILAWVLRLWNADLSIPFVYAEDDMLSLAVIKGMVENGWYLRNPSIGMPTGLSFYDFAAPDTLHFLLIKGIAFATRDAVSARNLYFLLTFPLTTLCALFALRRWGIAAGPAVVASLLYAFTPYHLLRGTTHLFLSAYYLLPLAAILFLWVSQGEELLLTRTPDGRWRPTWNRKTAFGLAVCVLLGMGGVYYAFFACFFFLVAAAADVLRRQCRHGVYRAGLLILVIGGTVVANLLPAILYHRAHGKNPEAAHRTRVDAEYYGLRMTQMLLPVSLHRVRPLAVVKERYNQLAPLVNENDCVSLGVVAGLGFVLLILYALFAGMARRRHDLFTDIAALNLSGFLLATMGGAGSLAAMACLRSIRCYNRMSIFLAFFSLVAVALLLDVLARRVATTPGRKGLFTAALAGVLLIGLLDQTNSGQAPAYARVKARWENDRRFVARLEAVLPPGAAIFQLPYMAFPEALPQERMIDYDHFRGYVHSRTLRWSYGAMKGRDGDRWQRQMLGAPVPAMVKTVSATGFRGIWVDRHGYADGGVALERALAATLHVAPLVSDDRRLAFYPLPNR